MPQDACERVLATLRDRVLSGEEDLGIDDASIFGASAEDDTVLEDAFTPRKTPTRSKNAKKNATSTARAGKQDDSVPTGTGKAAVRPLRTMRARKAS